MVKEVKDFDEYKALINSGKTVVVDWFATWCGPCKAISPVFAKMEKDYTNLLFVKVDVDIIPEAAEEAEISSMPTFHVYRSNEKIDEMVGAVPSALKALVEKHNSKAVNGNGETVKADGKRKAATAEDDDEWVDEKDDSKTGEVLDKARIVLLEKEVKDLKARLSALEEAFDSGSKRRRVD